MRIRGAKGRLCAAGLAAFLAAQAGPASGQTLGRAASAAPGGPSAGLPARPVPAGLAGPSLGSASPVVPHVSGIVPLAAPSLKETPSFRGASLLPDAPGSLGAPARFEAPVPGLALPVLAAPGASPAASPSAEKTVSPDSPKTAAEDAASERGSIALPREASPEDWKARAGVPFGEGSAVRSNDSAPAVRGSILGRLLRGLSLSRSADAPQALDAAPPAPGAPGRAGPGHSSLRNLLRGALYGVFLVASPIATLFAFEPADQALGLHPFGLLRYLAEAHPLFGVPLSYLWMGLSVVVPLLGLLALRSGVKKAAPRTHRLWVALGVAGLAAAAYAAVAAHAVLPAILLSMFSTMLNATGEEVMFRRGVLSWLKKRFDRRGWRLAAPLALVLSSVLFSLMHLPVHSFTLNLFALKVVLGLVLGLLYLRTGGLAAPAAAHTVYNLLVTVLGPLLGALSGLPAAGMVSVAVLGTVLLALRGRVPRPKGPLPA